MRASIFVLLTFFSSSCIDTPSYVYGPGPDENVAASAGTVAYSERFPYVRCSGPAEELELLGGLCSPSSQAAGLTNNVADRGFIIGDWSHGAEEQPKVLVFGYYTAELAPGADHAADVRWAAVLALEPPDFGDSGLQEYLSRSFASWPRGEMLSGTITTQSSSGEGCSSNVLVEATLHWRSTTIEFAAGLYVPC